MVCRCTVWLSSALLAGALLFGLCEADAVVVAVEGGVVLSDEDVSQNPQRSSRSGDVQAHESAQTDGLPGLGLLTEREHKRVRDETRRNSFPFILQDVMLCLTLFTF